MVLDTWTEKNQKHLVDNINVIEMILQRFVATSQINQEDSIGDHDCKSDNKNNINRINRNANSNKAETSFMRTVPAQDEFSNNDFNDSSLQCDVAGDEIKLNFGQDPQQQQQQQQQHQQSLPALETVCKLFGLSSFERLILLLCASVELKSEIATLCAKAHGDPNSAYATFGLALAVSA